MTANQTPRPSRVPLASPLLVGTVALHMALTALNNITDFETNQILTRRVLSMKDTFRVEEPGWRAIESEWFQDAVYVGIILWESVTALVLVVATFLWAASIRHRVFRFARRYSTLGLLMVMLLYGAGFIVIGGDWYGMWPTERYNPLDAALRGFLLSGVALVVTHLPTSEPAIG
ncbi:DUF2165 domain-containing protein [Streptomyces tailanensis]|uniref:DUF2165 domain-containing protein n=1 Tax=Streptomyces tailanensis TaxID=2569858 RepID=UPI00122DCCA7|nr:DUF2165 domain-containing protein [Streptomyces tailanensis]